MLREASPSTVITAPFILYNEQNFGEQRTIMHQFGAFIGKPQETFPTAKSGQTVGQCVQVLTNSTFNRGSAVEISDYR